jgi:two-component system OmpR family sensor kinase/two-component system sensor histidine kinase BaeS
MNRLWLRLGLMISGVLFFVFFLQFAEIMLSDRREEPPTEAEIVRRLGRFLGLSFVVGITGGFAIGRIVSSPITAQARAASQVEGGQLHVRVPVRGSREFRELATAFNRMAAALQQAETARNNLMADVSHELRTPLTVLEGNLRAALDHVQALDEAAIANLYTQTRHLIRLVNDLRELSLAETGQLMLEKTPMDVRLLVNETLQALEPLAAEKDVQLLAVLPDLPQISLDPLRIRQVLFNLLSNALRHTPKGGVIRVVGAHDAGGVSLIIEDTGEGLTPEQLASVFNRFYRADKSRSRETGGTGLGLAIVKAIVEAHDGTIAASSAGKGQGSRFTIALSDKANSVSPAPANPEECGISQSSTKRSGQSPL